VHDARIDVQEEDAPVFRVLGDAGDGNLAPPPVERQEPPMPLGDLEEGGWSLRGGGEWACDGSASPEHLVPDGLAALEVDDRLKRDGKGPVLQQSVQGGDDGLVLSEEGHSSQDACDRRRWSFAVVTIWPPFRIPS
jgi:hypothetical protein